MSGQDDDSDKSFEPTEQKLRKAREKGEVAKSTDLSVAAAYLGLIVAFYAAGSSSVEGTGTALMAFLDQPDRLAPLFFDGGSAAAPVGGFASSVLRPILPWFLVPFALVLLSIVGQRALVFAPSKLEPKLSRVSIISNAKNKFGRSGLFEFLKSFLKLMLYSICLGVYLSHRLPDMISSSGTGPQSVVLMLSQLALEFLFLALVISLAIGVVDAVFQHAEHRRKKHDVAQGNPGRNEGCRRGSPYERQAASAWPGDRVGPDDGRGAECGCGDRQPNPLRSCPEMEQREGCRAGLYSQRG